jgi:hypothetical protein
MSTIIQPFKCQDVLVKLGTSCEKQKEIYGYLHNLQTGVTNLAPNSVVIGSGLGDSSWNEALNYEKTQAELHKKLSEEAKEKAVSNISVLVDKNKKKDHLIYGIALVLVLGVVAFEVTNKK